VFCQGDVASINLCLSVVTELNAKMLEFDFRNGPLRRKYDGLKYAVRNIEDILFELSLQSQADATDVATSPLNTDEEVGSPTKRMRLTDTAAEGVVSVSEAAAAVLGDTGNASAVPAFQYIDSDEIDAIRARMDKYDQLRELVIKDSRDVQKLSKQAVYAVVRGQLLEARKKLDQAAKCADKIMETVNEVRIDYVRN
jgi:predicted translin family RNA/ssDNA-binding protein